MASKRASMRACRYCAVQRRKHEFEHFDVGERRQRRLLQACDRLAGDTIDLERALNALRVVHVDPRRRGRVHARELLVQCGPALGRGLRVDLRRAPRGSASGSCAMPPSERMEIEHRPADQQRLPCRAARSRCISRARVAHELARGVTRSSGSRMSMRWWGIARARREVRLGGADIHAAIHLRGVDADDLQRKLARQIERQRRFAGARRAHQQERTRRPDVVPRILRLRCGASAPAHEQPVEIPERQPHPGRAAVIALIRPVGALHLAQQRIHLRRC